MENKTEQKIINRIIKNGINNKEEARFFHNSKRDVKLKIIQARKELKE